MSDKLRKELEKPIEISKDAVFRFGKYAGMTVEDIPSEYLIWALGNIEFKYIGLKRCIEAELLVRCNRGDKNATGTDKSET